MYALLTYTDPITQIKITSSYPGIIQSIDEDIEMYRRHIPEKLMIFDKIIIPGTYDEICQDETYETFILDRNYRPNPFNAHLKQERYSYVIIPKLLSDPRDGEWIVRFDAEHEEKDHVMSHFDEYCLDIYKKGKINHKHKIFGSACHRGFVNHLFDYTHNSQMNEIREWIELIGDHFDPNVLLKLDQYDDSGTSIYTQGFYTETVKQLCKYCEIMFGIDRYTVANYFPKKDISTFFNSKSGDHISAAYNMQHVAAIFAEHNDCENARKYYQIAIDLIGDDDFCKYNYQSTLDEFNDYYKKHGTCVLSSFL